jgi:hypothetical protein
VTDLIVVAAAVVPFMGAGVVHVEPSMDVAYTGQLLLSTPTATKTPEEFTVTEFIKARSVLPFMYAGVDQP